MLRTPQSKSQFGNLHRIMVYLLLIVLLLHPSKAEEDSILSLATVPTSMYNSTPNSDVFIHGSFKSQIRTPNDTPNPIDVLVDLNLS